MPSERLLHETSQERTSPEQTANSYYSRRPNMNSIEIPDGLTDMLRDFTVAVLREHPRSADLYDFAVDYFTRTRERQLRSKINVPMYVIVDDDEEACEPDKEKFKPKNASQKSRFARRQSVSAERYDPEMDVDDDGAVVVYPKTDEQRRRLADSVSGILIFRSLDSDQMKEVIDAMFERHVEPEEAVIRQGDDGDNFYVIESGIYYVWVHSDTGSDKKIYEFNNKGSFGELALMYNQPRSATIRAVTAGTLWAMDRTSFKRVVLKSAFRKRKMYEELLESVPMLSSLDPYERVTVADALTSKIYEDGQCIIKEADEADGMYFVEDGTVRVTMSGSVLEEEVALIQKGRYFGEMALVENMPRSASVYALGRVKVAFLERKSFERLLGPCLDIMKRNIKTYKHRNTNTVD